jgi:hypothetical protein
MANGERSGVVEVEIDTHLEWTGLTALGASVSEKANDEFVFGESGKA